MNQATSPAQRLLRAVATAEMRWNQETWPLSAKRRQEMIAVAALRELAELRAGLSASLLVELADEIESAA